MRVLVIGNGGREHALAWKLAQAERVSQVFVAPGNGGTARDERLENVAISATDPKALADFATRGWLRLEARAVVLLDVERLRRRAR